MRVGHVITKTASAVPACQCMTTACSQVKKVCCIVLKKVLALEELGKEAQFSHRDLNDGNIMLKVRK